MRGFDIDGSWSKASERSTEAALLRPATLSQERKVNSNDMREEQAEVAELSSQLTPVYA
jgi:hypothetical protein